MRTGIPGRHGGSRLAIRGASLPSLHRNGHAHHNAAIAIASYGAGFAAGTAAGALMARTRRRAPGAEEPVAASEAE
jgi:hypothetical protein